MMYGPGYDYGYGMMGGGWLGGLLMLLFGAVAFIGVVLLVVWAVRTAAGHGSAPHAPSASAAHDEAVAIAKRRLASGEITVDQYSEIMRALGG